MNIDQRVLIAGLGSDWGDDRAGWELAKRLGPLAPQASVVALRSPAALLDRIADATMLHVVDACRGAGRPGTLVRCTWPAPELGRLKMSGTHDMSLPTALQIADSLGILPKLTVVWGIEMEEQRVSCVGNPAIDPGLSPTASAAIDELTLRIIGELDPRRPQDLAEGCRRA